MKSEVRFGRVSNIDYPAGTCEVTYKDRDETVTKQVSFISNRQYIMPKVGDLLIVLHPGTQSEDAVVLGTIWNNVNIPAEGYEGLYRKDYDLEQGKCYRRYDANVPEALYHIEGDDYVEVKKNQLYQIPDLMDALAANPLKFILFIDDLSFTANDDNFAALKAILEGSVGGRAGNIAVYATSNRRHLIKETLTDREGDDVHESDTRQELMSLSARFGLTITFGSPDRERYLHIVEELAKQYGVELDPRQLAVRSEAFAVRSGGRSARVAKQFIELCKAGVFN